MKLSVTNKHGKVVLNDKTINSLCSRVCSWTLVYANRCSVVILCLAHSVAAEHDRDWGG